MDAKSISPFLEAVATVMPQLGFAKVERGRLSLNKTNKIENLGVMVVVGLTHQLRGNIAYNMTVDAAKCVASKMMMGMPVETFDAMAESAIAELGNMLTANAAMIFEKQGSQIDISPPTVITGTACASTASAQSLAVEVKIDGIPLVINVSVT